MKIGSKTYSPRRPADLAEQLISRTGCDIGELARLLDDNPLAGTVARTLMPFLPEKDRPSDAELARNIAEAGVADVAKQVIALLGELPAPAPGGQASAA